MTIRRIALIWPLAVFAIMFGLTLLFMGGQSVDAQGANRCNPSDYYDNGSCYTYKEVVGTRDGSGNLVCPTDNGGFKGSEGKCWQRGGTRQNYPPKNPDGSPAQAGNYQCPPYVVKNPGGFLPGWASGADEVSLPMYYDPASHTCRTGVRPGNTAANVQQCIASASQQAGPSASPAFLAQIAERCADAKTDPAFSQEGQCREDGGRWENGTCIKPEDPDDNPNDPNDDDGPVTGPTTPEIPKVETRCGEARVNILVCGEEGGNTALNNILRIVVMVLTVGVGIAAVGGLAWASILYAKAEDNEGNVSSAKELIRNVVIGLLLYVFLVAITNWLVPGGVIG